MSLDTPKTKRCTWGIYIGDQCGEMVPEQDDLCRAHDGMRFPAIWDFFLNAPSPWREYPTPTVFSGVNPRYDFEPRVLRVHFIDGDEVRCKGEHCTLCQNP